MELLFGIDCNIVDDEQKAVIKYFKDGIGEIHYLKIDEGTGRLDNPFETGIRKFLKWKRVKLEVYLNYVKFLKTKNLGRLLQAQREMI